MAQELKAYSVIASSETQNYLDGEINLAFEAYDADEVDAVLAEKDKEIAELKEKYNELAKLYDKAIQACCDADKVIAELQEKRDTAEKLLNKALDCVSDEKNHIINLARKNNHVNYKRCLNNAWWCFREEFYAEDCHCERWVDWAIKWYKRWLELAEKFKEAK